MTEKEKENLQKARDAVKEAIKKAIESITSNKKIMAYYKKVWNEDLRISKFDCPEDMLEVAIHNITHDVLFGSRG